jgi:hypothetical protein
MNGDFKDNDKDPKDFIRANATFTHDFYLHGMSNRVEESPNIVYKIYDVETRDPVRYERVEENDQATHELIVHKKPEKPDTLKKRSGHIEGAAMKEVPLSDVFCYKPPQ